MIDVKALRARLGLTQPAFALLAGVSERIVRDWERGEHAPKGARLARLHELDAPVVPVPVAAPVAVVAPVPALLDARAHLGDGESATREAGAPVRRVLRLGEAVRLMGLKDEGHGRRSDHTIRKAIKLGRLHAWKAPGYRPQYAEWCFYADDFETWRATHYQTHRDPRSSATSAQEPSRPVPAPFSSAPRLRRRNSAT